MRRGDVIEVIHRGSPERRVIAYTYEHPSGTIAATLPASLDVAGWMNVDIRDARLSPDQSVDWSGDVGALRREAFEEHAERPPYVPQPRRLSSLASVFEMVRFYFGDKAADEYEGLCAGRLPDWYSAGGGGSP